MVDTYSVYVKCRQCGALYGMDVPKGQRRDYALKMKCGNCGIPGELRLI